MNPYVYSKRRSRGPKMEPQQPPSIAQLVKHVVNAPIGTALAFAIVVFAAGSVMAMTAPAYEEIAMGDMSLSPVQIARASGHVLGDSTTAVIDDSALEAQEPVAKLSVKAGSQDSASGRYNYTISYEVSNLSSAATLSIGNYVIKSGISESGSVETGSILKSDREYRVMFWVKNDTGKQVIARAGIKTPKGKEVGMDNKNVTLCKVSEGKTTNDTKDQKGATSDRPIMCTISKDGKIICPEPAECMPMKMEKKDGQGTMPPKPQGQNSQGMMGMPPKQ